jgi:TIR domain
MKIFLSWSGALSHDLAHALREWLPRVIHPLRPFFTPSDIEHGARWLSKLSHELEASSFGLFCLTADNLERPWLQFEAGAISKRLETARVCPVLFGIEPANIVGPLEQFQLVRFNEREMARLIQQLNAGLGDAKLNDAILTESFELLWPKLNAQVNEIQRNHAANARSPKPHTERELLEQSVGLLTQLVATLPAAGFIRSDSTGAAAVAHALGSLSAIMKHSTLNQPIDLRATAGELYSAIKFLFEGAEFPGAYDPQIRSLFSELHLLNSANAVGLPDEGIASQPAELGAVPDKTAE